MTTTAGIAAADRAEVYEAIAGTAAVIADDVKRVIRAADENTPRSQQRTIGPSEIGDPCNRYLAYKSFYADTVNRRDNWLANVGTFCHAGVADAFEADNQRLGRRRWVIEDTLRITDSIVGHGDLFDADTNMVLDHKVLGNGKLRAIRRGHISPRYRVQLHLYGLGHRRAGRRVAQVGLLAYPRNDSLSGDFGGNSLVVHLEPYDEQIALDALKRLADIVVLAATLQVDEHPDRYALIPAAPSEDCTYCPFFAGPSHGPADGTGCPGQGVTPLPTTMPGLTT